MHRPLLTACVWAALTAATAPPRAAAADLTGTFGVGGELGSDLLGGGSGLVDSAISLKYWVSDLGFQLLTGLAAKDVAADADAGTAARTPVTLDVVLRALYNLTRAEDTHLFIGAGVSLRAVFDGPGDAQALDLLFGVEHFFNRYFAVSGHVGAHIGLGGDLDLVIGRVSAWGTAFHFYF